MNQPPAPLFAELTFYVSPSLEDAGQLQALLAQNGGRVTDQAEEHAVYIVDSFEQDKVLFRDLISKGLRIISSRVIYESIEANKPLPLVTHPLYARFLEGLSLAVDESCPSPKRERLVTLLRYMGAHIVSDNEGRPSILVAQKVGSVQYQLCVQHQIPIVRSKWVKECWREQRLLPASQFALPPFAGLVISVTGLSSATREEVARLAKAFGGDYMANMTRRCTHLLALSPEGVKYRYAIEWGIHSVTPSWFFDSINSQRCMDERLYLVPMSAEKRQELFSPASMTISDIDRLSPALKRRHLFELSSRPHVNLKRKSTPVNASSSLKDEMDLEPQSQLLTDAPLGSYASRESIEQLLSACDSVLTHYRSMDESQVNTFLAQLAQSQLTH